MKVKNLELLKWEATISGKTYVNGVEFTQGKIKKNLTNKAISKVVEIFSQNLCESLQKIINKKSDMDLKFEKAKSMYSQIR